MDLDDVTVSSFTAEPDNMTQLHTQGRVPTVHISRHTDCGFLIEESRLPKCVPLPSSKISRRSWVWDHGILIGRLHNHSEVIPCWLCTDCYHQPQGMRPESLSTYLLKASHATNRIIDHMVEHHYYSRKGEPPLIVQSKKRKVNTLTQSWMDTERANKEVFNVEGWKATYCRWIACSGVSLRQATQKETIEMLTFQHPRLKEMPATSPTTAGRWIKQCYKDAVAKVTASLAGARGQITISFDGWKANNGVLDLLGVMAHYIGHDYKLHTVVLGLRNTLGSHTGRCIAEHLHEVLHDFSLRGNQIAYFAADNATNNDKALELLSTCEDLPFELTNYAERRLRCCGHIYNLVCNAILYGVDKEALVDASQGQSQCDSEIITDFETTIRTGDEEDKMAAWRKKGPVGRLHNTMVHIRANNRRRVLFEGWQSDVIDAAVPIEDADGVKTSLNTTIYRAVVNGGIRWNSTYLMIERALLLKEAITLYQANVDDFDDADCLRSDDWLQLSEMKALLSPIAEASMRVQSKGTTHGALHDTLTTMD